MMLSNDDSVLNERLWQYNINISSLIWFGNPVWLEYSQVCKVTISLIDFNGKCILVPNKHELPIS